MQQSHILLIYRQRLRCQRLPKNSGNQSNALWKWNQKNVENIEIIATR
jgi:hypothetical protein